MEFECEVGSTAAKQSAVWFFASLFQSLRRPVAVEFREKVEDAKRAVRGEIDDSSDFPGLELGFRGDGNAGFQLRLGWLWSDDLVGHLRSGTFQLSFRQDRRETVLRKDDDVLIESGLKSPLIAVSQNQRLNKIFLPGL